MITDTHAPSLADELSTRTIRDLVDAYPRIMTVLAPLGIDLCCGGAHRLGEALDLHGIDRDSVLPQIVALVERAAPER